MRKYLPIFLLSNLILLIVILNNNFHFMFHSSLITRPIFLLFLAFYSFLFYQKYQKNKHQQYIILLPIYILTCIIGLFY